ncbi:hypothetical protein N9O57_01605 [bacterium]|nr:hypothetical protein [bacterium]
MIRVGRVVGETKEDRKLVLLLESLEEGLSRNPNDYYTIAEQILATANGLFAVGNQGYYTHDLGHISALIRSPLFMKTFRNLAKEYKAGGFGDLRSDLEMSYTPFLKDDKTDEEIKARRKANLRAESFKNRYIFVSEWLVLIEGSTPEQTRSILNIPAKEKVKLKDIDAYVSKKMKSNKNWAQDAMIKYLEFYDSHAVRWGGAANDAHNPIKFALNPYPSTNDVGNYSMAALAEKIRFASKSKRNAQTYGYLLARLYKWAILTSAFNQSEDWLKWAFDASSVSELGGTINAAELFKADNLRP